jgi:hypothetical protein
LTSGNPGDRGDDEFARHRLALTLDAAGQLAKLLFGGLGHQQQITSRLGGRIAPRMALKELGSQPLFQRVNVADHGGMMHTQNFGRARHGAQSRNLKRGANFVPVFHVFGFPVRGCTDEKTGARWDAREKTPGPGVAVPNLDGPLPCDQDAPSPRIMPMAAFMAPSSHSRAPSMAAT